MVLHVLIVLHVLMVRHVLMVLLVLSHNRYSVQLLLEFEEAYGCPYSTEDITIGNDSDDS